jgi:hypothetical protein
VDRLPQPYRMIDKVLAGLLDRAACIAQQRAALRALEAASTPQLVRAGGPRAGCGARRWGCESLGASVATVPQPGGHCSDPPIRCASRRSCALASCGRAAMWRSRRWLPPSCRVGSSAQVVPPAPQPGPARCCPASWGSGSRAGGGSSMTAAAPPPPPLPPGSHPTTGGRLCGVTASAEEGGCQLVAWDLEGGGRQLWQHLLPAEPGPPACWVSAGSPPLATGPPAPALPPRQGSSARQPFESPCCLFPIPRRPLTRGAQERAACWRAAAAAAPCTCCAPAVRAAAAAARP